MNEQKYITKIPHVPPVPPKPPDPPDHYHSNITTSIQPQLNSVQPQSQSQTIPTISGPSHPMVSSLLKQQCFINDWTPALALVDSGAACCFISRQFANQNNIEILQGGHYKVTLADKSVATTNEMVIVTLDLCNVNFTMSAIVMDQLATGDLILGINFLKCFNPTIDWYELTMSINTDMFRPALTDGMSPSDIILASFSIVPSTTMKPLKTMKTNVSSTSATSVKSNVQPRIQLKPLTHSNDLVIQPQQQNLETNQPGPMHHDRIKIIPIYRMKRLLKDPTNVIVNSIYMLPMSTSVNNTNVTLNQVQIMSGNNSNYDTQATSEQKPQYNEYELQIHNEYKDVFESMPKQLPPRREHDHAIELIPGSQPPSKSAYRLSSSELDELRKQLDTLLAHGFIRTSKSPFGAPMLFVRKKDNSMRMCIDYRSLNQITIKNKYPLPRVDELLDRLAGAKYFTKIDLQSGYHQIRMKDEDIHKTAFRTRYGSFEFLVLPFGLTNAPSTFMAMMQSMLKPYLDKFCISFLDDILIYSSNLEEHLKHVKLVMDALRQNQLYVKLSKCSMFQTSVEFLGYTISQHGLSMVNDKVKAIQDWPVPTSVKHVRSFLGLAGFYRQFIKMFSSTTSPLTALLQKESSFNWTNQHQVAFDTIKQQMSKQPTLILPRDNTKFVVHTDSSAFAVGASLMQDHGQGLQPIAFLSKKLLPAETRYATHEQELLAIIIALQTWRHYLYGRHFIVQTDHHSLVYFMKQQNMSNRQARWSELIQQYDFTIEYKAGESNVVADALSRRADHEMKADSNKQVKSTSTSLNQISTLTITHENILTQIKQAYQLDEQCKQILDAHELEHKDNETTSTSEWKVTSTGMIQRHEQILVPNSEPIRTFIIQSNHDDTTASHRGAAKTIDLVTRTWYWKNMHHDIKHYVSTCLLCQQNKISNQSPLGLLHPISTPDTRWHTVSMDLITSLPKSKSGNDAIIVFVDKLSKMVHYVPTITAIDAPTLATLMINNVIRLHGIPIQIISDRDPRFTSSFWKALWLQLGTKLKMSTAYHPQSDGLTERNNRTLEESLRNYVNYHQTNWDTLLPLAEFAYNNAVHSSTGYSPFFLNSGQHPVTPSTFEVRKQVQVNDAAATMLEELYSALNNAQENIDKSQAAQKKQADKHRRDFVPFEIGDLVLLSTYNLRTPGRASKLIAQRIGPFKITKVLSKLNYELELPSTLQGIHNRFHVQQLTKFNSTNDFPSRPKIITRPPAETIADTKDEVYEVAQVLKHRGTGTRLQYLIHWKGYPDYDATWEPVSAFKDHRDAIDIYERQQRTQSSSSSSNKPNTTSTSIRMQTRNRH